MQPTDRLNYLARSCPFKECQVRKIDNKLAWVTLVLNEPEDNSYLRVKNSHFYQTMLFNTETGEIYHHVKELHIFSTKIVTYVGCILGIVNCPVYTLFKILYHLAIPISLTNIVIRTINDAKKNGGITGKEKEIFIKCLINSVNSLSDIIRTPLYGIAMTIVLLATVLTSPFNSSLGYQLFILNRRLVNDLHRNENKLLFKKNYKDCIDHIVSIALSPRENHFFTSAENVKISIYASVVKNSLVVATFFRGYEDRADETRTQPGKPVTREEAIDEKLAKIDALIERGDPNERENAMRAKKHYLKYLETLNERGKLASV